jgi:hypothetical protein
VMRRQGVMTILLNTPINATTPLESVSDRIVRVMVRALCRFTPDLGAANE